MGIDVAERGYAGRSGRLVEVRIHGLRQIREAMQALPARMDRKLLNRGLMAGARLIRDEARRRVPVLKEPNARRRAGTLKRAIRAGVVRPERYAATTWVRVRPLKARQIALFVKRTGKLKGADNPNDPYYWRFVEFGTSKMPARPFLRPAFESQKLAAVHQAIAELRPLVEREIEKLGRVAMLGNRFARSL